jgi:hypothetical protein
MINSVSRSVTQSQEQAYLDAQPTDEYIRRLVAHCRELTCQYQTTPAVAQERAWWKALYRAGTRLHVTLEEHQERWERLYLSDAEVERAYMTLLQVNYFFEPGQLAEVVFKEQGWAWLDDEPEI